jgi:hypothetical protein
MFLALKNGLGRTVVFFRGLLDEYGGSAAAYSLRRLGSAYSGPIVKVRRDSDQAELDFTSVSGVEDWVNGKQETTLPADIATSAAAYGLRKLRSAYTGDAVHIRRLSDDVEVNVQFDSNDKVSASSPITNVEDISLINESGFATDTGGFSPSISGANFTFGNTLDGKSDVLFATFDGSGNLGISFPTSDVAIGDVIVYNFEVYWQSTNVGGLPSLRIRSGNTSIGHSDDPLPSEDSWYTYSGQFTVTNNTPVALTLTAANSSGLTTGDVFAIASGSYAKKQDEGNTTATTLGGFLTEATPGRNRTGSARYDTFTPDGVTGFTAITNNIAACGFDIAGSNGTAVQVSFDIVVNSGSISVKLRPDFETGSDVSNDETITTSGSKSFTLTSTADFKAMLFITASADFVVSNFSVNVPYNHSATVVTWYDQSGNANHATQTVAGDQPKIAEAGALLADGIDFDGVGNYLETTNGYIVELSQNPASVFAVATPGPSNTGKYLLTEGDSLTPYSSQFILNGSVAETGLWVNTTLIGNPMTPSVQSLTGFIYNETTFQPYLNGAVNGTATAATVNTETSLESYIGSSANADTGFYTGRIAELITYKSDQTNNRFKIESNINNYHDIYTAAEDGYVETWYDQSGNSNNAVHPVLSLQPQIVDSGALMTDENGSPTIQFFHTNTNRNYLEFDPFFATGDDISAFVVTERELNSDWNIILGYDNNNQGLSGTFGMSDNGATRQPRASAGSASINNSVINDDIVNLRTVLWDNSSLSLSSYIDGGDLVTATGTQNVIAPPDKNRIGDTFTVGVSGTVKITEIVLYNSDQSANRTDIESNIAEAYGITLP